jgi:predicted CopG family antitoxin
MENLDSTSKPEASLSKKLTYKQRTQQIRIDITIIGMLEQLRGYKESLSDVIRRAIITAKMDTLRHDLTAKKEEELEDEIEETKALRENIAEIEGESE